MASPSAYERFSSHPWYVRENRHLVDASGVGAGHRVLDLCSGTGASTAMLLERRPAEIRAMDNSSAQLEAARKRLAGHSNVSLIEGDALRASEHAKDMDRAFCFNAVHYFEDKDRLFSEVRKTLAPGGRFSFNSTFFEGGQPRETMKFYILTARKAREALKRDYPQYAGAKAPAVAARKRQMSPGEYRAALEKSGFRVKSIEEHDVEMDRESFYDIAGFEDFSKVMVPGAPPDVREKVLREAMRQAFDELGWDSVKRKWLSVVAEKPA